MNKPLTTPEVSQECMLSRQRLEREQSLKQSRCNVLSVGSMDLIKSLQHSERDIFYSTIWEDYCLPAMHPMFQALSGQVNDHPILRDATLALSSCNFSRLHPDKKDSAASHMGFFSPNLVHQTRSQLYYSSAIRRFTVLSEADCRANTTVVLTVLTVFAYIESSMGNFRGFYCHDQGMSCLLLSLNTSSKDQTLKALLEAWIQIRIVIWWARAHFCSLEVQQHLPSVLLPGVFEEGLISLPGRRVNVLSIMCESHRLNFRALMGFWYYQQNEHLWEEGEEFQTASLLLAGQAERLDRWLAQLHPSDLPIEDETLQDISQTDLWRAPIYFQSHEAALNFAYYVVGRIMQCTELLESLRTRNPSYVAHACRKQEEWAWSLLRIVKGTNMQSSLRMNNYTIGFSGLLLTALLRCQSQSLGIEIQGWLQSLVDMKPTEEGAFPLYQTLGVVKAINQQKMMHRDVFGVTIPVDDEGGTPKFTAYNSQPISTLLIHGMCRTSGDLFTECVLADI